MDDQCSVFECDARLARDEFDRLAREEQFRVGPRMSAFGDGYGEPYQPFRQIWGVLKDGRKVRSDTDPKWCHMCDASPCKCCLHCGKSQGGEN